LITGRRKFAPRWMQRMGLTWLYRLAAEPARLGPRYLQYNLMFLYYFLGRLMRGR
jgi:N-acetylglucosaminyldiphosphoundecaprenol N-acetyl-beta-D-mannosaminyltransferase